MRLGAGALRAGVGRVFGTGVFLGAADLMRPAIELIRLAADCTFARVLAFGATRALGAAAGFVRVDVRGG